MSSRTFEIIEKEIRRQENTIELIASENFVSEDVMRAVGSVLTNKYTEGYPAGPRQSGNTGRYYGGCEYYDELEEYCCDLWRQVFGTNYHVNVQPHSGSSANMAAYMSILDPGDSILAMSLDAGGHLTHSSPVSFVSKLYKVYTYGVDREGYLDYEELEKKIRLHRPKLIVVGASSYSRYISYARIRQIIDRVIEDDVAQIYDMNPNSSKEVYAPYYMVDMAHVAGLIAAGQLPSPFGYADIITTTTHKTLRGPRGGLIFCKPELAKKVDSAVFPRCQGGSLQNVIAGKCICAEEALRPSFREYAWQVIDNAKAMADEFINLGYKIVSGGTDNHMFLLDLTGHNITGLQLQEECDKIGITLNKNAIPNDPLGPRLASGVRIGTPAMTTKGWGEDDFRACARMIDALIKRLEGEV